MTDQPTDQPTDQTTGPRSPAIVQPSDDWFRRVTFYSVLAGLTPLVPIPFLDDRILLEVQRRMAWRVARDVGVPVGSTERDLLVGARRESRGCVGWALWMLRKSIVLLMKLLRKIFRKILVFLAIKEGIDTASRTFHEGYLLHVGLSDRRTARGAEPLAEAEAATLRGEIEAALARIDPRPVEQAIRRLFRGSRELLTTAALVLARPFRGPRAPAADVAPGAGAPPAGPLPEDDEAKLLGGLVDRLSRALWREQGYLELVATELRRARREVPPPPSGPPGAS